MRLLCLGVVGLGLLGIVACGSTDDVAEGPSPVVWPEPDPEPEPPREPAARENVAYRSLLDREDTPSDAAFGVAVILAPPAADFMRYRAFCRAFFEGLPRYAPGLEAEAVFTYWPSNDPDTALRGRPEWDCSDGALLSQYPYDAGQMYAQMAGAAGASGPMLIAFRRVDGGPPEAVFGFDLSNAQENDMDRAIRLWRGEITREMVRGRRWELVRAEVGWKLDQIAPGILKAFFELGGG